MITQEQCPRHPYWSEGHRDGHDLTLDFNDDMAATCSRCGGIWRIKVTVMGPKGMKKVDISVTDAAWVRVE